MEDDDEEEDDGEYCPLCVTELDETDMEFKPCSCDYRVCLYCFHKLKKCPACRMSYRSLEEIEEEISFTTQDSVPVTNVNAFSALDI